MAKTGEIFKCRECSDMVQAIRDGTGELVCCGKPMELLEARSEDEGQEKHVPIIEKTEKGIKVKVGSVPHPMEDNHFIEWIEVVAEGISYRRNLTPGSAPEAEFCLEKDTMYAREHCNIHGLWKSS